MPEDLGEKIDLHLAWRRAEEDIKDMTFIDNPYELDLIKQDLERWLGELKIRLSENNFTPQRCAIVDVPRPNWHLRPGGILRLEDIVVYHALLLTAITNVKEKIRWSERKQQFCYIILEDQTSNKWFDFEMKSWDEFRKYSLAKLSPPCTHVVFADIAAFYENIDLKRLASDLADAGVDSKTVTLLNKCLNRWAEPRGRGIPQGYRPSAVLAKLYLDAIDRRLHHGGFDSARYVDDIRIFCSSEIEARKALHYLTIILREKGLNLQTAKSYIKECEEAKLEIDGVAPVIEKANKEFLEDLRATVAAGLSYATPSQIRALLKAKGKPPPLETLTRVFKEYFLKGDNSKFDKTLFHYLINRLAASKNDFAVEYCLSIFFRATRGNKVHFAILC